MRKLLETELLYAEEAASGYSSAFDAARPMVDFESILHEVGSQMSIRHRCMSSVPLSDDAPVTPVCMTRLNGFFQRHSEHQRQFNERLTVAPTCDTVSLHGNLSPAIIDFDEKENVAFGAGKWIAVGDPAIDLAHLMAHLFLISTFRQSCILLSATGSLHMGYFASIEPDAKQALAYRAGPLTAAFMLELAGTVEYLQPQMREELQMFASFWLVRRDYTLGQVSSALWTAIDMGFHNRQIDWRNDVHKKTKHRYPAGG